jgi:hypothetical protein
VLSALAQRRRTGGPIGPSTSSRDGCLCLWGDPRLLRMRLSDYRSLEMFRKCTLVFYQTSLTVRRSMPPCAGLRAHVELSKISGYIICETFKIAPRNCKSGYPANNIDIALGMLQAWQEQLPVTLQMPTNSIQGDPACGLLHMAHNQLIVLVCAVEVQSSF